LHARSTFKDLRKTARVRVFNSPVVLPAFNVDLPRFLASGSLRSLRTTVVELTADGQKDVTGLTKSNTEKTSYNVAFILPIHVPVEL